MDHLPGMPENVHPVVPEGEAPRGPLPELWPDYQPGDQCTITEDIRGNKGRIYANQGDPVRIIANHGNVMIAEHAKTGERFPVQAQKLKPKA